MNLIQPIQPQYNYENQGVPLVSIVKGSTWLFKPTFSTVYVNNDYVLRVIVKNGNSASFDPNSPDLINTGFNVTETNPVMQLEPGYTTVLEPGRYTMDLALSNSTSGEYIHYARLDVRCIANTSTPVAPELDPESVVPIGQLYYKEGVNLTSGIPSASGTPFSDTNLPVDQVELASIGAATDISLANIGEALIKTGATQINGVTSVSGGAFSDNNLIVDQDHIESNAFKDVITNYVQANTVTINDIGPLSGTAFNATTNKVVDEAYIDDKLTTASGTAVDSTTNPVADKAYVDAEIAGTSSGGTSDVDILFRQKDWGDNITLSSSAVSILTGITGTGSFNIPAGYITDGSIIEFEFGGEYNTSSINYGWSFAFTMNDGIQKNIASADEEVPFSNQARGTWRVHLRCDFKLLSGTSFEVFTSGYTSFYRMDGRDVTGASFRSTTPLPSIDNSGVVTFDLTMDSTTTSSSQNLRARGCFIKVYK